MFTPDSSVEKWQEVETSKETKNFGTHKDLNDNKLRAVTHKASGLRIAAFSTMRDAHKFMVWCQENIGNKSLEEMKPLGKKILTQLHEYPSQKW
jgi:hypothetical protein